MRAAIGVLSLVLMTSCGREATTPIADDAAFDIPADQVMFFTEESLTYKGIRRGELAADTLFSFEQSRLYDLRKVKLDFYEDNGVHAGTLTSNTADYDVGGGIFIANGNVVLVTPSEEGGERRLETEELVYDVAGDRLSSDKPFVLYEGGQTTRGRGFRSDAEFKNWEVTGAQTEGTAGEGGFSF